MPENKRCQGYQGLKGVKGVRGQKLSKVPESKAQKLYSGAGFSRELISDRALLLKKVKGFSIKLFVLTCQK